MRSGMTWKLALCLGLALASVGCQNDDPSGVLPGTADPGLLASNNLTPAIQGSAVLEPIAGGQASSVGSEADARMAELVATAVLASFDTGNAGMVSSLSGLGSVSTASTAGAAKTRPVAAREAAAVALSSALTRWKAATVEGAGRVSPSRAARRQFRRKPRMAAKAASGAPAAGEAIIQPYPLPDPDGLPDPGPVRPGVITTAGPAGEVISGGGWSEPGRPYPGWDGGSVEPGGVATGSPVLPDPETRPRVPYPGYPTRPPEEPWLDPGQASSGGATAFTTLADGFEFRDGATCLAFHGASVRWGAAGVPSAVAFSGPVRVQGRLARDDGSIASLRLGLTGLSGMVRAPVAGESEPIFQLEFAEGGVTLQGQVDATDFTLSVSGVRGVARELAGVTRLLAAGTLSVTASARNLGSEVGTLALDAHVRHPRLSFDGGGSFAAEAVWGRATVGFGPGSEPLLKEGVQAATLTVDESRALVVAPDGRLVSGTAGVELSYADGRRNSLTVAAAEGRLSLDGTLLSGGGATERVETTSSGQVRVTGQARLRDGSTERHEVELPQSAAAGPMLVNSKLTDAQGRGRAEVRMRLGSDRTGEGSWLDLQQADRRGTFRVDAAGVVHLLSAQGAELATARLAKRGV